jgi:hypothetical protein
MSHSIFEVDGSETISRFKMSLVKTAHLGHPKRELAKIWKSGNFTRF